ncbi:hypothetical protein HCC36_10925 [Listeria booriae]|uniref:DUF2187 domain-containing protein n=1 Tax=Listeria booriae TaxID=1552123 RepID=A0A842FPS6_9LIST|nr:hypothetical protein [Listeria booriae]MBC2293741.1 hypothetical protein [Listeria booriae]
MQMKFKVNDKVRFILANNLKIGIVRECFEEYRAYCVESGNGMYTLAEKVITHVNDEPARVPDEKMVRDHKFVDKEDADT